MTFCTRQEIDAERPSLCRSCVAPLPLKYTDTTLLVVPGIVIEVHPWHVLRNVSYELAEIDHWVCTV